MGCHSGVLARRTLGFTETTVVGRAVAAVPAHCDWWCGRMVCCEVLDSSILRYGQFSSVVSSLVVRTFEPLVWAFELLVWTSELCRVR